MLIEEFEAKEATQDGSRAACKGKGKLHSSSFN